MSKNSANGIYDHICKVMIKLDNKEISVEEATAQSKNAKAACDLLNYELKRAAMTSQPIRELTTEAFDGK